MNKEVAIISSPKSFQKMKTLRVINTIVMSEYQHKHFGRVKDI